jgi:hypothetical protein
MMISLELDAWLDAQPMKDCFDGFAIERRVGARRVWESARARQRDNRRRTLALLAMAGAERANHASYAAAVDRQHRSWLHSWERHHGWLSKFKRCRG